MKMAKFGSKVVDSTKMVGNVITSTEREDEVKAWHSSIMTDITPNVRNKEPHDPFEYGIW